MMPPLIAEESMREAERLGVGTGALKAEDQRPIIRRWQADRDVVCPIQKTRPTPQQLGGAGIGYRVVERA
jgi:hypothetical protein